MTQQEEKQAIIDILDFELFPKFNTYGDKTYDGDFNLIADKILTELSELRKPSEENRARIMELLWVFSCDSTTDPKEITEEIIRAAQNCEPEPSEPIGRTDEDLVNKITDILLKNHHGAGFTIPDFKATGFEIAKLLPSSRSGENGVNVELLEALEHAESVLSENFPSIRKANNKDLSAMKDVSQFEANFSQECYNAKAENIRLENIELRNLIIKLREVIAKNRIKP